MFSTVWLYLVSLVQGLGNYIEALNFYKGPWYQLGLHVALLLTTVVTLVCTVRYIKRRRQQPSKKEFPKPEKRRSVNSLLSVLGSIHHKNWVIKVAGNLEMSKASIEANLVVWGKEIYVISAIKDGKYVRQEIYHGNDRILLSAAQKTKLRNMLVRKARLQGHP